MARKMPGRTIARPVQGRVSLQGTKARRVNIVGPLVHTAQHKKPLHGGSRPGANG